MGIVIYLHVWVVYVAVTLWKQITGAERALADIYLNMNNKNETISNIVVYAIAMYKAYCFYVLSQAVNIMSPWPNIGSKFILAFKD